MTNDQSHTTPGAKLREAREQCGYQQSDISQRLRLSVQVIIDIENDDYSHFAAEIYLCGYMRSYARLVNLEPESVVAMFHALNIVIASDSQVPVMLIGNVPVSREVQRNKRSMIRWMGLGLVLVMIVMVALWWNEQEKTGSSLAIAGKTTVTLPLNIMVSKVKAAPKVMMKFVTKPIVPKKRRVPIRHVAVVKPPLAVKKTKSTSFVPDYQIGPAKSS
jgi:DNA-binding XRE family transcriptional regulator